MSGFFARIRDKIKSMDKAELGSYLCVGGAGLISLLGGVLDKKSKDRKFKEEMTKEIRKQAATLLKDDETQS